MTASPSDFGTGGRGEGRRSLPAVAPATLPPTPLTAAEAVNRHLDRWVEKDAKTVLSSWRERDALKGREISWGEGSGVADGVDERGNLVVVVGDDRVSLGAGEVHLRL